MSKCIPCWRGKAYYINCKRWNKTRDISKVGKTMEINEEATNVIIKFEIFMIYRKRIEMVWETHRFKVLKSIIFKWLAARKV